MISNHRTSRRNAEPFIAKEKVLSSLLSACVAVLAVASFFAVFVNGPAAREIAEQQMAEELAAENRAFCEKFGMPAGTREHELCGEALIEIRARQDKRRADEMQGIL